MTFSTLYLESFLLILVRITAFMYVAPFFSLRNVPQKLKVGLSFFISMLIYNSLTKEVIVYDGVIEFATLIIKEAIVGFVIGFFTNASYYIINFVGQFIDNQVGFSMVNELDPVSSIQSTITSNFYSYMIMLMLLVTNLHHYIIIALVDTFKIIPITKANINTEFYKLMLVFLQDYFIIGFRIVLPVFASSLIVTAVLGILTKVAPQINMFVVGFQIKILIGLITLLILTAFIPQISTFIFDEMILMMKSAIEGFL